MDINEKELNVVHENDLVALLKKINFYNKLVEGTLKCKFCHKPITIENLHSILPQSAEFSFICDEPVCVQTLVKYLNEKNSTVVGTD